MSTFLVLLGVAFVIACLIAGLMGEGLRGLIAIPIALILAFAASQTQNSYPEIAGALAFGAAAICIGALIVNTPG